MIRSAVLVSGKGTKLQSLLDSVFFGEIPELQLVAVISSDAGAYALKRARNAGIETVVVEPGVFPNDTSYDMAIRNKLKDMDIELVDQRGLLPRHRPRDGEELPRQGHRGAAVARSGVRDAARRRGARGGARPRPEGHGSDGLPCG
ncbi:MAG: formyltransferase family protein [Oscillospiraceae bacterium]